jgi:hypothetical protein
MRRTSQLYVQAALHPDEVPHYVFERRADEDRGGLRRVPAHGRRYL